MNTKATDLGSIKTYSMSTQLDTHKSNDVFLTLAKWHPMKEYGCSGTDEIGFRRGNDFTLIQWSGLPTRIVWPLVKRLTDRGRDASRIRRILTWLENRSYTGRFYVTVCVT
jgi:hypothetical protein